jgi:hypothetical protein
MSRKSANVESNFVPFFDSSNNRQSLFLVLPRFVPIVKQVNSVCFLFRNSRKPVRKALKRCSLKKVQVLTENGHVGID